MRDGIAGTALPADFPYKQIIEQLCFENNVSPCLVGAIKMNETGLGQGPETENDISGDGGHGIMQLTSSFTGLAGPGREHRLRDSAFHRPGLDILGRARRDGRGAGEVYRGDL